MIVFAVLVLSLISVAISYRAYSSTMDEQYKMLTSNLAKTVASQLDAKDLMRYYDAVRQIGAYDDDRYQNDPDYRADYDAKADAVSKLLPVYDNLERALTLGCTDEAFFKGIQMTMNQLEDIFAKLGVSAIEAVGQPFDPAVHNAVMHVDDESLGENVVAEELQKGFKLGDKVIRFAMVKVAN